MFSNKKQKNMDSKNNVKINFVEPNTKIIGEIESKSDFRIDGTLDGKINTSGRVVIGKEGTVNGEVQCGYADVIGNFNGSLSSSDSKCSTILYNHFTLVDHLGGLDLALERAAELAEIEDYRLTTYPKFDDDLESILEGLVGGPFGKLRTQLPPEISMWIQGIEALENPANQLQTRLPYTLNVN